MIFVFVSLFRFVYVLRVNALTVQRATARRNLAGLLAKVVPEFVTIFIVSRTRGITKITYIQYGVSWVDFIRRFNLSTCLDYVSTAQGHCTKFLCVQPIRVCICDEANSKTPTIFLLRHMEPACTTPSTINPRVRSL